MSVHTEERVNEALDRLAAVAVEKPAAVSNEAKHAPNHRIRRARIAHGSRTPIGTATRRRLQTVPHLGILSGR